MRAVDFEYSGRSLSEFGMIICNFDSKGVKTISNGSYITFNDKTYRKENYKQLINNIFKN